MKNKNEYDRWWYHNRADKKKVRKVKSDRRLLIRKHFLNYLNKQKCIDCGESDAVVLEFDHVKGEKVLNISNAVSRGWSIKRIENEISKCEIRCANCHRRKTAKQLGWYKYIE